jgi:predicted nuclease of predicted toxin-antitoxin system
MDVHVPFAVTDGLRRRGVDVRTAQEDDASEWEDSQLLDHAASLNRILVTQDKDFLAEAARRQQVGQSFAGVVYGHQERLTIGQLVHDLELIAKVYEPEDMKDRVEYLPL